jgi:hypothetical protein
MNMPPEVGGGGAGAGGVLGGGVGGAEAGLGGGFGAVEEAGAVGGFGSMPLLPLLLLGGVALIIILALALSKKK